MEQNTDNFPVEELRCKCQNCKGEQPNKVKLVAIEALQRIRDELGEPMVLTSAYRCPLHDDEVKKSMPGTHNRGVGFDILVPWGNKRMRIIELAIKHGFKGFGFAESFLHIDMGSSYHRSWGYS